MILFPELQILVCDDDARYLQQLTNRIQALLDARQVRAKLHTYASIRDIPQEVLEKCHLAVLDIDFPAESQSGIDLARLLRTIREDVLIIFVSNYIQYAPEGYEVHAFRFIMKEEVPQKLGLYLSQALEKLGDVQQTLTVMCKGKPVSVALSDILYIEAQAHTVLLHLRDGQPLRSYASIGKLEEELEGQCFLRLHKGFLVNMTCIEDFRHDGALLTSGANIPVSEKSYAQLKKKYLMRKGWQ